MEPNDNYTPLKYEKEPEAPIPNPSLPPDMKNPSSAPSSLSALPSPEKRFIAIAGIFLVVAVIAMLAVALWPPSNFPKGQVFSVAQDSSLGQVAGDLYGEHLVRSIVLFKIAVVAFSGERGIKAGDYLFAGKESVLGIAWRLVRGEEDLTPIKVTIPEGWTASQISSLLGKDIPGFATSTFLAQAQPDEGYLFPDTYFFNKKTSPDDAIKAMQALFGQEISSVAEQISASGRATSSVVVMASMLEREATSSTDRRIIAGILWKRLDAGQPLEVDATLAYVLNKSGSKLTSADLATDSPYNTYKNAGLPPTPISNPGLETIEDAVNPTATDYWYYISDSKGNIHYAATYEEQLANESKYL